MRWSERLYAMGIHIIFSCVLLSIALYLVFVVWYPSPLDQAMGVNDIFWIFLSIDLILGPLLTFIVFNKNKKELKRDLAIIVVLQISAYLFGLHTVAQGRPVWQVFVVDDIELVRDVDSQGENSTYKSSIIQKPMWTAAVYSSDPKIAQKQKEDEMFNGVSLATQIDAYQPIENRKQKILQTLKNIEYLDQFNESETVEQILKKYPNAVGYLPVKGYVKDMSALFDSVGTPIAIVDLRPWN